MDTASSTTSSSGRQVHPHHHLNNMTSPLPSRSSHIASSQHSTNRPAAEEADFELVMVAADEEEFPEEPLPHPAAVVTAAARQRRMELLGGLPLADGPSDEGRWTDNFLLARQPTTSRVDLMALLEEALDIADELHQHYPTPVEEEEEYDEEHEMDETHYTTAVASSSSIRRVRCSKRIKRSSP